MPFSTEATAAASGEDCAALAAAWASGELLNALRAACTSGEDGENGTESPAGTGVTFGGGGGGGGGGGRMAC